MFLVLKMSEKLHTHSIDSTLITHNSRLKHRKTVGENVSGFLFAPQKVLRNTSVKIKMLQSKQFMRANFETLMGNFTVEK